MKKILFVCVHNSGRSQMAEAFFNEYSDVDEATTSSAGTLPTTHINPNAIKVMDEVGINISPKLPKMLTMEMMECADKVITMGCGVENVCPATFIATEDWELEDPEGKPLEVVRHIRNKIKARVLQLIEEL